MEKKKKKKIRARRVAGVEYLYVEISRPVTGRSSCGSIESGSNEYRI